MVATAYAWAPTQPVQPMIDSGVSGMGFVDPAFVQRCGAQVRPSKLGLLGLLGTHNLNCFNRQGYLSYCRNGSI